MSDSRASRPERTRFAPSVGARRPPASADGVAVVVDDVPARVPVVHAGEAVPARHRPSMADGGVDVAAVLPTSTPSAIEAVAARRERRRSVADERETRLAAAGEPRVALPAFAPGVTMASFLRDTGAGVPMAGRGSSLAVSRPTTMVLAAAAPSVSTVHFPQVRIVDGQVQLHEGGVEREEPAAAPTYVAVDVVNESRQHITSHAFVKTIGANRWSRQDTDRFHEAVSMCGTDFAIMALLFPNKTREQIKGKYRVEERTDPDRLAASLARRIPLSQQWLAAARAEREAAAAERLARATANGELVAPSSPAPSGQSARTVPSRSATPTPGETERDYGSVGEDSRRPGRPRQQSSEVLSSLLASPVRGEDGRSPPRRGRKRSVVAAADTRAPAKRTRTAPTHSSRSEPVHSRRKTEPRNALVDGVAVDALPSARAPSDTPGDTAPAEGTPRRSARRRG